jgi:hypothetical protein
VYKGEFKGTEDFKDAKPVKEGKASEIDVNLTGEEDNYAIVFSGTLVVPEEDEYSFSFGYTGGIKVLTSEGETFVENLSPTAQGDLKRSITLPAGKYPFTIYNYKSAAWRAPRLGMFVQGTKSHFITTILARKSHPLPHQFLLMLLVNPNCTEVS